MTSKSRGPAACFGMIIGGGRAIVRFGLILREGRSRVRRPIAIGGVIVVASIFPDGGG
jgi:hypothetical protein